MTLEASVTLQASVKVQCLRTIVRGEVLHQFDLLSDNIESITPLKLEAIILGLGASLFMFMRCQRKSAQCTSELGSFEE